MTDDEASEQARQKRKQASRESYNARREAVNARRRELYAQMVESDPERHAARKAQMHEHAQAVRDAEKAGGPAHG